MSSARLTFIGATDSTASNSDHDFLETSPNLATCCLRYFPKSVCWSINEN